MYTQFIINLDAWFLAATEKVEEPQSEDEIKFIYPNVWGAVNSTKTIIDEDDVTALQGEMTDSKLRRVFNHFFTPTIAI